MQQTGKGPWDMTDGERDFLKASYFSRGSGKFSLRADPKREVRFPILRESRQFSQVTMCQGRMKGKRVVPLNGFVLYIHVTEFGANYFVMHSF